MHEKSSADESDDSGSSSEPSCDNMEAFILDELQGVIAVEKDKQERMSKTLKKKEKNLARLMKKEQPRFK